MIGEQKPDITWEQAQALVADLVKAKPYLVRPESAAEPEPTAERTLTDKERTDRAMAGLTADALRARGIWKDDAVA